MRSHKKLSSKHALPIGVVASLALAMLLATMGATPALAADATVTTEAEFLTAIGTSDSGTITLGADITVSAAVATVTATDATIDLNGHALITKSLALGPGTALSVTDSASGGSLTANATTVSHEPGIRVEFGSTLTLSGGTVTASGGDRTPGIGGQNPGTLVVDGADVTAWGNLYAAGVGGEQSHPGGVVNVSAGSLTAYAGQFSAGIGGGFGNPGGTVTVSGGTVVAYGVGGGAGIGGAVYGDAGGTTTISGGSVTATASGTWSGAGIGGGSGAAAFSGIPGRDGNTVLITGGVVVATSTGQYAGAGIGGGGKAGGAGGNGGSITIGAGAVVSASGSNAVGNAASGSSLGSLTIAGTLNVPSGSLTIPAGDSVTVTSTGAIAGAGSIGGLGSISNLGAIRNATVADAADGGAGLSITTHNYLLTFDANQAGATPVSTPVRVYGTSFVDGNRFIPSFTHASLVVLRWAQNADGTGGTFTPTSPVSADDEVYGVWVSPTLVISPAGATATAGTTTAFTVEGFSGATSIGDYTGKVTLDSSVAGDSIAGADVTAQTAGTRTITARLTADTAVSTSTTLEVTAGAPASLALTSGANIVLDGTSTTLQLLVYDAYGNPRTDLSNTAGISSDSSFDIIASDKLSIELNGIGDHIITATLGTLTDSITLSASPPPSLQLSPANTTVSAGDSVLFRVDRTELLVTTNATAGSTITSDVASDTETFHGLFVFTEAGIHTITAVNGGISTTTTVTVVANTASVASLTLTLSGTSVAQGGSVTAVVTGEDNYGNDLGDVTALATLTSDHAADVISGNTIRFPSASIHQITASLGGATTTAAIQVIPTASALAATGTDSAHPQLAAGILLLLGSASILLVRYRRRRTGH